MRLLSKPISKVHTFMSEIALMCVVEFKMVSKVSLDSEL